MKFLHISDLHFGKQLFAYSLLEDQRHWCSQVIDFLRQNPHDAVVIAGDLYDRAVPGAEAVELMDSFLCSLVVDLKLPVLAIAGNHDSGRRLSFGSSLYRTSGLYMAAVPQGKIQRVTLTDSDGKVDFWLLPFITPADAKNLFPGREISGYQEAYRAFIEANSPRLDATGRNVLVAHGFFSALTDAASVPLVTSDSEVAIGGVDLTDAGLFRAFDYCAFGHLHAPQRVGGQKMRYSGSPLCYSVSEEHQNKALLSVELTATGLTFAKTELPPLRRLYSVTGTLEQLSAPTGGEKVCDDYVYVNIVTQGTELAAAQRVRNLYPNYLGISYKNAGEQEVLLGGGDILRRRGIPETFGDFYRRVTANELTEAGRAVVEQAAKNATRQEVET